MITPRQRLAIVTSKCFSTAMGATKDILRHAVYSEQVGREIRRSEDLTDDEVKRLLEIWEDYQYPLNPSMAGKTKIQELAKSYQQKHGQTEMQL